ncbi:hypothetical protein BGZ51_000056 [Haplosporangium sp. Z 767]|nr:hypothetical protein BGZ50_006465 [Haplosporangium sp. Z 11]KAF9195481.1 hypothetical protein BGZ51_000056 [Haplosporangium sp. Z 767]
MSNSAVAKWLEEIAAAKAKAQSKASYTQQHHPSNATIDISTNADRATTARISSNDACIEPKSPSLLPSSSQQQLEPISQSQYGTVASFDLKTRKKLLRLVLPPEPIKPGPGECCGNDCDPCINTIYWQDLAAHRELCKRLTLEYETACLALASGGDPVASEVQQTRLDADIRGKFKDKNETLDLDQVQDDGSGLSIRSYKPFMVLKKRYLSENTLQVVCDVAYPKVPRDMALFHILIRFRRGDQFVTKAFTPVDMSRSFNAEEIESEGPRLGSEAEAGSSLSGKLTFLVKLYPSPHDTSDMFRALEEYNPTTQHHGIGASNESEVLFLRGPIQTSRDILRNSEIAQKPGAVPTVMSNRSMKSGDRDVEISKMKQERIVMIAAGSGITPMYQFLRAIHQHQEQKYEQQEYDQENEGEDQVVQEVDLIYCNRTTSDIWLRQELQELCSGPDEPHNSVASDTHIMGDLLVRDTSNINISSGTPTGTESALAKSPSGTRFRIRAKRRRVRVQHVVSSLEDHHNHRPDHGFSTIQERIHAGRITRDLLRDTLQQSMDLIENERLRILVCGPPLFNADVSRMLSQLGFQDSESCEIHILE